MKIPVKHHYIPQVYLKYWENENRQINYLDLNNGTIELRNKNSIFYQKNLYAITLYEFYLLTEEEKQLFIEPLKKYKVFMNNKLLSEQEIIQNLSSYSMFEIKDSCNRRISKLQKQDLLEKILNSKHPKIEESFSRIESQWSDVVSYFENFRVKYYKYMLTMDNDELPKLDGMKEHLELLLNFVLATYTRNPFVMENKIRRAESTSLPDNIEREVFVNIVIDFLNGKRFLFDVNKYDIQLIFAAEGEKFITCDNPVIFRPIEIENFSCTNIFWFPMSPKILIALSEKSKNNRKTVLPYFVTDETIRELNRKIVENAVKAIVLNE